MPALEHGARMFKSLEQILKSSNINQFLGDFEKFLSKSAEHLESVKHNLDGCMNNSLPTRKANSSSLNLIEGPHMRTFQSIYYLGFTVI